MNRAIVILTALAIIIMGNICSTYAEVSDASVMAEHSNLVSTSLSIDKGKVTVKGTLKGVYGITTKATVHLYLQQYSNKKWIIYDSWFESKDGTDCTLKKVVSVPKGYRYRTKISCYAYSGLKSENIIKFSDEIQY